MRNKRYKQLKDGAELTEFDAQVIDFDTYADTDGEGSGLLGPHASEVLDEDYEGEESE